MRTSIPSHITPEELDRMHEDIFKSLAEPAVARPKVVPRQASEEELTWCEKLRKLMAEMPSTMALYGQDGTLRAIDVDNDDMEWPESLFGVEDINICIYVPHDD